MWVIAIGVHQQAFWTLLWQRALRGYHESVLNIPMDGLHQKSQGSLLKIFPGSVLEVPDSLNQDQGQKCVFSMCPRWFLYTVSFWTSAWLALKWLGTNGIYICSHFLSPTTLISFLGVVVKSKGFGMRLTWVLILAPCYVCILGQVT